MIKYLIIKTYEQYLCRYIKDIVFYTNVGGQAKNDNGHRQ